MPQPFGPFSLLKKLADGGMAVTWLARHRDDPPGQEIALKRILPSLLSDAQTKALFEEEARIATRLQHPHVVRTWDTGVVEGEHFLAMEYLFGEDMRRIAERAVSVGRPMPLPLVVAVIARAARGLHYVHELRTPEGEPMGLVHRDISPPNIMVGFDGQVKVIDFGVVRAERHLLRVRQGQLKGKGPYMSPEQVQGLDIDRRSDIFSLGILLYEFTTLKRLFKAESEVLTMKLIADARVLAPHAVRADYPLALEEIVMRALARDPKARFATADAFAEALEAYAATLNIPDIDAELSAFVRELFPDRISDIEALTLPGYAGPVAPASLPLPPPATPSADAASGHEDASPDEERVYDEGLVRDERQGSVVYIIAALIVAVVGGIAVYRIATGRGGNVELQALVEADRLLAQQAQEEAPPPPAPPEPASRVLTIDSTPPGAWVVVNGVPTGERTPATVSLVRYTLNRVALYAPHHDAHVVIQDEGAFGASETYTLPPLRAPEGWSAPEGAPEHVTRPSARTRIQARDATGRVEGARVRVNGQPMDARTPADLWLPADTPLHIMLEAEGYQAASTEVRLRETRNPDDPRDILLELIPAHDVNLYTTLRVEPVPAQALVTLEGPEEVDGRLHQLRIPGHYILRVQAPEHDTLRIPIQARGGSLVERVTLPAVRRPPSRLNIRVSPEETIIYGAQPRRGMSANAWGTGEVRQRVMDSGHYELTFSYRAEEDRRRGRIEVELPPGIDRTLHYRLTPEGLELVEERDEPWEAAED